MKKFRQQHKLLFNLSIIGIVVNLTIGITLKTPVLFGDADIVNYFLSNFLGNLFWGITISTIFYYICVWNPEKKKLEELSKAINMYRDRILSLFNAALIVMINNGEEWSPEESREIITLINGGSEITNEQINSIATNFHKNQTPGFDQIRSLAIGSRINSILHCTDKLLIIYGAYLSTEEIKTLDKLNDSLFVRDLVTNNNGGVMYDFYHDVQELKNYKYN